MPAGRSFSGAVALAAAAAAVLVCAAVPALAQSPDAVLRGIAELGIEVDTSGAQAATCGVNRDAILAAVTKTLTDAGLKVNSKTDTDVFLYVNVNTVSPTAGLCVSRYDVSLNAYVTAKLPYQPASALLQVLLAREGGLAGSGPATHGESVVKAVRQYVDLFAKRIKGIDLSRY
jgi:hypothetical protein